MLFDFFNAFLFLVVAIGTLLAIFTISNLLAPDHPTPEKEIPYECGEDPLGTSYVHFNIRFYVVALIFLIFDVEVAMLFPWAIQFQSEGIVGFAKMVIFVTILLWGLLYAWGKGDLNWVGLPDRPVEQREQKGVLAREIKEDEGILQEKHGQVQETSGVRMDSADE